MTVKVKMAYKTDSSTLMFEVTNEAGEFLVNDGVSPAFFEAYSEGRKALYRTPMAAPDTFVGIFEGSIPLIDISYLPLRVYIWGIDTLTIDSKGPVSQGQVYIDKNNNEQDAPKMLNNIFASTVYNNLGVGTAIEEYYGADNFLAFTTTFDTNGNRSVVLE